MEQIILFPIPLGELKEAIADLIDQKIKHFTPVPLKDAGEIYLSREEVSKQLKISMPTLRNLTLQGVITGHRLGPRKILYKRSEVESALHEISANKYKRKDLTKLK